MKTKVLAFLGLVGFLFAFLGAPAALATSSGALPIRSIYSAVSVPTTSYVTLVASTVKGVKGMQVNNTGVHPVMIAFGAVGVELPQILVLGGEDTGFMPVAGGYGQRVSVTALDGANSTTGELDLNLFYN